MNKRKSFHDEDIVLLVEDSQTEKEIEFVNHEKDLELVK
jgi:hypothetical protein